MCEPLGRRRAGAQDFPQYRRRNLIAHRTTAQQGALYLRGRVWLTTPDPQIDPAVDFRQLTDERDLVRMRDGVGRLFDLARHEAISAITVRVLIDAAGRSLDDVQDECQLDEWLQAGCADYVHAVGTCRMGPPDDPQSVVDSDGHVIGVEGLRVVDASIMPEVPRANTHLTTVMIAEHIAARMAERWPFGATNNGHAH